MSDEVDSFWGEIPKDAISEATPIDLLSIAARELAEKTNQVIQARVTRRQESLHEFRAELDLVVPSLGSYSVTILSLFYPLGFYPIKLLLKAGGKFQRLAKDLAEFNDALHQCLSADATMALVMQLLRHAGSSVDEELVI